MLFQSFAELLSAQNTICSCRPVSLQGRMSFRYMTRSCVVFSHTHGNMSVTLGSCRLREPAVVSLTVIWLLFMLSFVRIFDWVIIQRAFLKEQSLKFTLGVSDPDPSNVSQDLVWISISSMLESAYTAGCKADHDHGQRPDLTKGLSFFWSLHSSSRLDLLWIHSQCLISSWHDLFSIF